MKKLDLGEIISIVANLGVIASIGFLAFQLEQNNRLLRAQASFNLLENRARVRDIVVDGSEAAEFWTRVNSRTPLSAADEFRLIAFVQRILLNWQFEYGQYVDGNLSESELPIEAYVAAFEGQGFARILIFQEVWESFKDELRPEFIQWMEENVVNRDSQP